MKKRLLVSFVWFLFGCAHSTTAKDRENDRKQVDAALSGEMSLKADREELAELRREIPAERQKANDELALYLQLMKQGTEQPQIVRDKFTNLVQKKRTSFRDKVSRLRENYRRAETKRREQFLAAQKDKRENYLKNKRSSSDTRAFFDDQDRDRQRFFADERARRQSFEAEVDAETKDFNSYMRQKNDEFNEQYRLYSKQFAEKPKEKKAVTGEGGDYKQVDPPTTKTLSTED